MKPFLIVCAARTGSTWLRTTLNEHPHIICHGEIMAIGRMFGFVAQQYQFDNRDKLLEQRDADLTAFLLDFIYKPNESQAAVGAKLLYQHLMREERQAFYKDMCATTDIHIIHLKRRNRLRRLVSITRRREGVKDGMIRLLPKKCRQDFKLIEAQEQEINTQFVDHPMIEVYYEDLVAQFDEKIEALLTFLDIQEMYQFTGPKDTKSPPLSEVITNYEPLKQSFKDTSYQEYFD